MTEQCNLFLVENIGLEPLFIRPRDVCKPLHLILHVKVNNLFTNHRSCSESLYGRATTTVSLVSASQPHETMCCILFASCSLRKTSMIFCCIASREAQLKLLRGEHCGVTISNVLFVLI